MAVQLSPWAALCTVYRKEKSDKSEEIHWQQLQRGLGLVLPCTCHHSYSPGLGLEPSCSVVQAAMRFGLQQGCGGRRACREPKAVQGGGRGGKRGQGRGNGRGQLQSWIALVPELQLQSQPVSPHPHAGLDSIPSRDPFLPVIWGGKTSSGSWVNMVDAEWLRHSTGVGSLTQIHLAQPQHTSSRGESRNQTWWSDGCSKSKLQNRFIVPSLWKKISSWIWEISCLCIANTDVARHAQESQEVKNVCIKSNKMHH